MKKFYFIVNPISGHANNTKYAEDIIALLHKKADVETHIHVLQARGEAEPYAAKLADEIMDDGIIVSVGGDGTFNEIASSLVGKSTPIAIIPRGSGNGLARMLRVPTQKALQAEYLLKGHTIKIDNGNFGDRKYFCTAGFGFEACIAFLFDKTGNKKRGRQQYVQHIIKEIFKYKPVEAELEIDGKREKGKYFSLCIANANQYGNNAIISPSADLTDGKIGLLDLMLKTGLVPSKREARQLIQQGGVMLNGEKVTDTALYLGEDLLREGVILKKGKKVYHKVIL